MRPSTRAYRNTLAETLVKAGDHLDNVEAMGVTMDVVRSWLLELRDEATNREHAERASRESLSRMADAIGSALEDIRLHDDF